MKWGRTMNKRACVIIAMLLCIWLMPFLKFGPAAAQELLIYPAAGLTSDEQVPFRPEIPDALTGLINNPNDIGMVMYSKPSFSGDIMMTVMNNTPVSVTSEQREADGYRWIRVQTKEGFEGWVFATGVTDPDGNLLVPAEISENRTSSGSPSRVLGSTAGSQSGNSGVTADPYAGTGNTGQTGTGLSGGIMVWVYRTGQRYHSHHGCSGSDDWQVTLEEAQIMGRTPCKKCY